MPAAQWSTAHFALIACDIFNEQFLGSWNGCGSTSHTPSPCKPHIPDLATLENSLWVNIKGQVAANWCSNNHKLYRAM